MPQILNHSLPVSYRWNVYLPKLSQNVVIGLIEFALVRTVPMGRRIGTRADLLVVQIIKVLMVIKGLTTKQLTEKGSGCGAVDRAVASDTRGPRFEPVIGKNLFIY